ncbi:BZ3500_MvSof-1268-A1-R1_Chr1-2g01426 [Microbotryum saponariae]|uniref:BZ3500_MvSof-1268-A1-R1_Chr1-2g01426 protein n=1 Tax=Microbotryum saponariae TaxID=289078 RepID=A0A2X0MH97_9BASI|nr:BZ3500_MvSof-1268-A1-R1_Chr1-2g01426 [Microbotryum saponariae]SCZ97402.1 BZ3501_MvSof-1269-A2-R1_Chr1-2g01025 [Microbotryum saponariae]
MAFFGLGSLAYFILLLINAVAILHKERFLAPLGLTTSSSNAQQVAFQSGSNPVSPTYQTGFETYGGSIGDGATGGAGDGMSVKSRAIMLVDAIRTLMRIPLIPINIVVIIYELVFGSGF